MVKTNTRGLISIAIVAILTIASLAGAMILLKKDPYIIDDLGREIIFDNPPERIISLGPSFTEVIIALGGNGRLIGVDHLSASVEGVPEDARVLGPGPVSGISNEDIVDLEPDCVLIWGYYTSKINFLEECGITVLALNPASVQDTFKMIENFGVMLNSDPSHLINDMSSRMDKVKNKVQDISKDQRIRVYLELGSSNNMGKTVNADTLSSDIIEMAGGINVFASNEESYSKMDREAIVGSNPQVVIVEESSIHGNDHFHGIVDEDHIYRLDTGLLTTSPKLVDALEQIAKWLYPDLF